MTDAQCEDDTDCGPWMCCSEWGFCGKTSEYCGENARCAAEDDCPAPGQCCGAGGYCGDLVEHCAEKTPCGEDGDCPSGSCCNEITGACVDGDERYCDPGNTLSRPTDPPSPGPTPSPFGAALTAGSPTPSSSTAAPTSGRTAGPTASPTAGPAAGATASPTTGPTASPTSGPTAGPAASPTGGPTAGPTASPTSGPTTSPTGGPTAGAAASPTGGPKATSAPTAGPSSSPSSSPHGDDDGSAGAASAPTTGGAKVARTRTLPGGAKVTRCVPPDEPDDNIFAEDAAAPGAVAVAVVVPSDWVAVPVDFWYAINVAPDADADVGAAIRSVESAVHDRLVAGMLDCGSVRRRGRGRAPLRRRLRDGGGVVSLPSAISTLKDDALAEGAVCDDARAADGYSCLVIDGGVTSYHNINASVAELDVKTSYLAFVRESMERGAFDGVDGVHSVGFIGAPMSDVGGEGGDAAAPAAEDKGGGPSAFDRFADNLRDDDDRITWFGGLMIGLICACFVAALYLGVRTTRYIQSRRTERLLSEDEGEDGGKAGGAEVDDNARANSSFDARSLDDLYDESTMGGATGSSVMGYSVGLPDKSVVRVRAEEAKAIVLNDEYSDTYGFRPEDDGGEDNSLSGGGGSFRESRHDCDDPGTCVVCSSMRRPAEGGAPESAVQVEFRSVLGLAGEEEDDEDDEALAADGSRRRKTKRFYEVEDTVDL